MKETQLSKLYDSFRRGDRHTALTINSLCSTTAGATKASQVQQRYGIILNKKPVVINGKRLTEWSL